MPSKKLVPHSYVVKNKSSGLRNVLMLSSVQPLLGVTKDDNKFKPAIYKLYDFTKGGTDIVDQRVGFYSCKSKSPRWTMVAFFFLLDTCRVNSGTVYFLNKKKDPRKGNSFDFGWKLGMQLILPLIRSRPINGLSSLIQQKIKLVLSFQQEETNETTSDEADMACEASAGNYEENQIMSARSEAGVEKAAGSSTENLLPLRSESRKQCGQCLQSIQGRDQKRKKNSLSKVKQQCQCC